MVIHRIKLAKEKMVSPEDEVSIVILVEPLSVMQI